MDDVLAIELLKKSALKVRDPSKGCSVWDAGRVGQARVEHGRFLFRLVAEPGWNDELKHRIVEAIGRGVRDGGWDGPLDAEIAVPDEASAPTVAPQRPARLHPKHDSGPAERKQVPGVRHVVAVASGKGGVGKSTVAVQLAFGLRRQGFRVGLLDADLYGPSLPTLLGLRDQPVLSEDERMVPPEVRGVRCMSIGLLLGERQPLIWRGPLVSGVIKQFLEEVAWGALDYLIIDLPPGTGDTQLTLIQNTFLSGVVIVSTPQELALLDAVRGLEMFAKLDVPILGVVENMAWYVLPDGSHDEVFGHGGARDLATRYGVELLAEVPLDRRVRLSGDAGDPESLVGPAAEAFDAMARKVAARVPVS